MPKALSIADYIDHHSHWRNELQLLCDLCAETELESAIKWGTPMYSINGKNIVGIAAFKNHFAMWFHQGVFMKDPAKKLINANEEQTKALLQWRFSSLEEIDTKLIRQYLQEVIANEKAGKRIKIERDKPIILPEILETALTQDKNLKSAFEKFTKSKQREFAEYISSAKREETRFSRLNKCVDLILDGVGLHDKYKK